MHTMPGNVVLSCHTTTHDHSIVYKSNIRKYQVFILVKIENIKKLKNVILLLFFALLLST